MMILYTDANNNKLIDFNTLQTILKTNKSKLYRALGDLNGVEVVRYKNQFLYYENTLFMLMREKLIERIERS